MKWSEFTIMVEEAIAKMDKIRKDFPDDADFLFKTSVVISHKGKQLPAAINISTRLIAEHMPNCEILMDSQIKKRFQNLAIELKRLVKLVMSQHEDRNAREEARKRIVDISNEIALIPCIDIEIENDISIEMIFPTVRMDTIQALKAQELVDRNKTCLCKACIRVYLA